MIYMKYMNIKPLGHVLLCCVFVYVCVCARCIMFSKTGDRLEVHTSASEEINQSIKKYNPKIISGTVPPYVLNPLSWHPSPPPTPSLLPIMPIL